MPAKSFPLVLMMFSHLLSFKARNASLPNSAKLIGWIRGMGSLECHRISQTPKFAENIQFRRDPDIESLKSDAARRMTRGTHHFITQLDHLKDP